MNRLNRELSALRRQQQHQQQAGASASTNGLPNDDEYGGQDPRSPGYELVLEILRRENENLRSRLTDLERDYIRMKRLNEIYREELIDHRSKV